MQQYRLAIFHLLFWCPKACLLTQPCSSRKGVWPKDASTVLSSLHMLLFGMYLHVIGHCVYCSPCHASLHSFQNILCIFLSTDTYFVLFLRIQTSFSSEVSARYHLLLTSCPLVSSAFLLLLLIYFDSMPLKWAFWWLAHSHLFLNVIYELAFISITLCLS